MIDLAATLARIEVRHKQAVVADRLSQVIARQRRELATETSDKKA